MWTSTYRLRCSCPVLDSPRFTNEMPWKCRVNTLDGSYEWSASVLLWFCFVIVAFFWDAMLAYRRYTVRSNIPYIFNFFMTLPRFDRCWQSSNQEHCSWHTWESNNILGWSWKNNGVTRKPWVWFDTRHQVLAAKHFREVSLIQRQCKSKGCLRPKSISNPAKHLTSNILMGDVNEVKHSHIFTWIL